MGIKFDLEQILNQVGRDKGIDKDVLIGALESAVLSAAKKHFGHGRNIEARYDAELGEIEVLEFKTVVEKVVDSSTQISVEEAAREFDIEAEIGEELGKRLPYGELGRIAAQTAKQVIAHKFREAERDIIFHEFRDRKGDLVNGIVQRFERGNIIINLGRTDAILPEREQIPREHYQQNDRIRAMILDIESANRGPQIVLTRSHPDFLRRLFELEVPEISEGIIEIKNVAREPGERAKLAVFSNDPGVDPRGACIGIKGSRVQTVVSELKGERIEIVLWSSDAPSFVARSLSPAEVLRVVVDEEEHAMEVVVVDDQLSLAIGKKGQNVRLASKLTGWRIDVRSESSAEEEASIARQSLESIPGLGFGEADLLFQEGYRSASEVAAATVEELGSIEGMLEDRAEFIFEAACKLAEHTLIGELDEDGVEGVSDIEQLLIPEPQRRALIACGFAQIESVAGMEVSQLERVAGLSSEDALNISEAAKAFVRAQKPLTSDSVNV